MADIQILTTSEVPGPLLERIRAFVDEAFDRAFSGDDWDHTLGGWHVVVDVDGDVVAHAATVPRAIDIGGRPFRSGYVEAVATAPAARRAGHGSQAMTALMDVIRREFEIGLLSTGRHGFYERLGWERWLGPTFVVRDGERVRTPEDDDGIMALRLGPSAGIALTEPIACPARSGDDW